MKDESVNDGPPMDIDGLWQQLVAVAVLGTDRRDPPDLGAVAGPIADLLTDLLADRAGTGTSRLLTSVAAVAAVRRAAFVPLPPADLLAPPLADTRPWCSAEAVRTWRTVARDWPVLEDEWLAELVRSGFAPPPDLLVDLLVRHRSDAVRRARVSTAAGPTTGWLVELVPSLGGPIARATQDDPLPKLPMPPDLARLVTADAPEFVAGLRRVLTGGASAHRPFLVNLLARCRPAVLPDAIESLADAGHPLADLARLRLRMLDELTPPSRSPVVR